MAELMTKGNPEKDLRKALSFRKDYDIGSYNWSLNSDRANEVVPKASVQKIVFREYQPQVIIDLGKLIDGATEAILATLPGGQSNTLAKVLVALGKGAAGSVGGSSVDTLLMQKYLTNANSPFEDGLSRVKNLFPGDVLYTYQFPYHDTMQIEADTTAGWSNLGSTRFFGKGISEAVKSGFNVDFPTTPQWTLTDQKGSSFTFTFDLINDTSENTANNWKMLHAFTAGCFWLQMDAVQKSPNIFRVELEGRWEKFWCAVGVKAETLGRLFVDSAASQKIGVRIAGKIRFPEAWKVTINVVDLTQCNYNVFGNYLLNGSSSLVSISRLEKFNDDNSTTLKDVGDLLGESGKFIGGKLREAADKVRGTKEYRDLIQ